MYPLSRNFEHCDDLACNTITMANKLEQLFGAVSANVGALNTALMKQFTEYMANLREEF